jgi:hypothetical protein
MTTKWRHLTRECVEVAVKETQVLEAQSEENHNNDRIVMTMWQHPCNFLQLMIYKAQHCNSSS